MDPRHAEQRHQELLSQGWVRRFSAMEPRLSEMKIAYEELGFEVHIEDGGVAEPDECDACFTAEGFSDLYKTIYTRGSVTPAHTSDDELFD